MYSVAPAPESVPWESLRCASLQLVASSEIPSPTNKAAQNSVPGSHGSPLSHYLRSIKPKSAPRRDRRKVEGEGQFIGHTGLAATIFNGLSHISEKGFLDCTGHVYVEPSSVVLMGTNVSVTCISSGETCRTPGTFSFTLDDDAIRPRWSNRTQARLELTGVTRSHAIYCFVDCMGELETVCWNTFSVGYPPDHPFNITCSSEEHSTNMRCTWQKGRATLISTDYLVHVKNLQTSREYEIPTTEPVTIQVNRSQDRDFVICVKAKNELGQATSDWTHVLLEDIVVPVTPEITDIEIQNKILIRVQWRKEPTANLRDCELAYKALSSAGWVSVGEQTISDTGMLSSPIVLEADAFRLRCRERKGKHYWSRWSDPKYIPQTGPHGMFDVWRALGPVSPDGSREVLVLIKPRGPEIPWAKDLGYNVFYEDRKSKIIIQKCNNSQLQCNALVPQGIKTISVESYTSQGTSKPRQILVWQDQLALGFPGPRGLQVSSGLVKSMPVGWEPLGGSASELLWFIVQWYPDPCDGNPPNISWEVVPRNDSQFLIAGEFAAGQRVTVSLYAVYDGGISLPSVNYGYAQELKPKKDPSAIEVTYSRATILIHWDEVPLCDQKGFIIDYTLHLKENSKGLISRDKSFVKHFTLQNLNPEINYELCISASTKAGEGPGAQCVMIQPVKTLQNSTELLLGISFTAVIFTAFILTLMFKNKIRDRIKKLAVWLVPDCLKETYPRIEKSRALQTLQENWELFGLRPLVLHSDPEITEVQEVTPTSPPAIVYASVVLKDFRPTQNAPFLDSVDLDVPEPDSGYQPQIVKIGPARRDSYCSHSQMLNFHGGGPNLNGGNDCSDGNGLTWGSGFGFPDVQLLVTEMADGGIARFFKPLPHFSMEHKLESPACEGLADSHVLLGLQRTLCLSDVNVL
ncbi:interleukin-23 receptor [Pelodytes ibericus]